MNSIELSDMRATLPNPIPLHLFVVLKHAPVPVFAQLADQPGRPWVIVGWKTEETVKRG
jgi:hypothetical protein